VTVSGPNLIYKILFLRNRNRSAPDRPKNCSVEALPIAYPTNHRRRDSNHRRHFSKPISAIALPPHNSTRSEPASYPIVIPLRTNHAIEQRYLSSYSATIRTIETPSVSPLSSSHPMTALRPAPCPFRLQTRCRVTQIAVGIVAIDHDITRAIRIMELRQ